MKRTRYFRRTALAVVVTFSFSIPTSPAAAQQLETLPTRVPAPSLDGGGEWLNTAGPLDLRDLRGKFVILDFWTYCCINCMHVLPELKKLERAHPQHLVVIGVHSAKFQTERDAQNVREAIERYEIEHPVVNDPQQILWRKYSVDTWPSLRVIDPEGQLVAHYKGEFTADVVERFLKPQIAAYRRKKVLDETPLSFTAALPKPADQPLRFPGKVLADAASGRLFIADSGHHRIVVAKLDGEVLDVIGSGAMGRDDGSYAEATFDHPQGLALQGETLFVADTENHLLRKVDLRSQRVTTIAGTGEQARVSVVRTFTRPTAIKLSSPWDLWLQDDNLYIAMAGTHQIWKMSLEGGTIGPFAGNSAEDIIDGALLSRVAFQKGYASFAQPSGLASDGQMLFVADSEGSSIRAVPLRSGKNVATVLGTSRLAADRLFTFGDRDGAVPQALLQHPLGVAYRDGRLYIADTYNSKIKELDLERRTIRTLAGEGQPGRGNSPTRFDEPGGLSVAGDQLYVADTNHHAIRVIELGRDMQVRDFELKGLRPPQLAAVQTTAPAAAGKQIPWDAVSLQPTGGELKAAIELTLPPGYKLNPVAPLRYFVQTAGDGQFVEPSALGKWTPVAEPSTKFDIDLPLRAKTGGDRVTISLAFYYCRNGAEGLCKAGEVTWSGRVTLSETAATDRLELKHVVPK